VAQALSSQNESLFSIQQGEHLKQGRGLTVPSGTPEASAEGKEKFLLLLVGTLLLLGLAGVGGWYTYTEFIRKTTPPEVLAPTSRFIGAESTKEINTGPLARDTFFSALVDASAGMKPSELRHFVLKDGANANASSTSVAKFLTMLESSAPGSLVRAFEPIFMLGSLGESRFILLKLASFENAFGGMLNWEKTMSDDIGPLFATRDLVKSIGSESVFRDVISRNKDVRVLFAGTTTEPVLLYSFFDNQVLIITDRLETLQTLIDRLSREKLTR